MVLGKLRPDNKLRITEQKYYHIGRPIWNRLSLNTRVSPVKPTLSGSPTLQVPDGLKIPRIRV